MTQRSFINTPVPQYLPIPVSNLLSSFLTSAATEMSSILPFWLSLKLGPRVSLEAHTYLPRTVRLSALLACAFQDLHVHFAKHLY